ncbi:L,D-transpeptidase family protein [Candidatus Parabeggiatoa sp. HSG14]|uniref:L,D-transpeptidase family protein n=1 Tax=Candidatus Parabeggiatoa sp. HSG14 TaxID=3055593 RepID=UPI0025A6A26A|nr:L,D-transpeptidase family protein [Thiotrichales bacterium HSG14]
MFWFYPDVTRKVTNSDFLQGVMNKKTVSDVLVDIGDKTKARLLPWFEKANVPYPPQHLALLGFKAEKRLEMWAKKEGIWISIRHYPILAASGIAGPKLREGDRQVPEGIYRLNFLNPNSLYHLSMQINYPNDFDKNKAAEEQRTHLGGDIFIHGKAVSIGCLAIGDEAIEELFVLVATIGLDKVTVILAPQQDMQTVVLNTSIHPWISELYADIRQILKHKFLGVLNPSP